MQQVAATGVVFLGEVARMYEEGYLGREQQIARPTREKETFYLRQYIVPRWALFGSIKSSQKQSKIGSTPRSNLTGPGTECARSWAAYTTTPKGTGYGRKGSAAPLAKRS